ncbi:MAG: sirohydrochlorin cobaltochelatase [Anaerorhabdus sp.]
MKDELIILVHIGTSIESVLENELKLLKNDISDTSDADVVYAFSSLRSIRKLLAKGIKVNYFEDLIKETIDKYKKIRVVPLHVVGGNNYELIKSICLKYADQNKIKLYKPILQSAKYMQELASAISEIVSGEENILFIIHKTAKESLKFCESFIEYYKNFNIQSSYICLNDSLDKCLSLDSVTLFPLLMISGYHVKKDIFDLEDSIYNTLVKNGVNTKVYNGGLLSHCSIRKIYCRMLSNGGK